jgi:DNA-binding cell septation regulator SpoVG
VSDIVVSDIHFSVASQTDQAQGLLGFLKFTLNDALIIDGVSLRRTLNGSLTLGFPRRTDVRGNHHPIIRPTDDGVRQAITQQIAAALGNDGAATYPRRCQAETDQ